MWACPGNKGVCVFVDSKFGHKSNPEVVKILSVKSKTTPRRRVVFWRLILHGLAGNLEINVSSGSVAGAQPVETKSQLFSRGHTKRQI